MICALCDTQALRKVSSFLSDFNQMQAICTDPKLDTHMHISSGRATRVNTSSRTLPRLFLPSSQKIFHEKSSWAENAAGNFLENYQKQAGPTTVISCDQFNLHACNEIASLQFLYFPANLENFILLEARVNSVRFQGQDFEFVIFDGC